MKISLFLWRCVWIWSIFLLPIDMLVVGKGKAIHDWKLNWNDDS